MPVNLKVHGSNEEVDECNEICGAPRIGDCMVQKDRSSWDEVNSADRHRIPSLLTETLALAVQMDRLNP